MGLTRALIRRWLPAILFLVAAFLLVSQWLPRSAEARLGKVGGELAFVSDLYERVIPSVVYISNITVGEDKTLLEGSGSGVICSKQGYIITNHHVVAGSVSLQVALNDGRTVEATLVAADPGGDLALLHIDAPNLTPAAIGDSDQVRVGELVFPLGNPGGAQFARSMTMGIISGVDRQILLGDGMLSNLLQTDAAINPGNSGGPLVNANGRVVGINSIKIVDAEYEGMGFAIPINTAVQVLSEMCPQAFE